MREGLGIPRRGLRFIPSCQLLGPGSSSVRWGWEGHDPDHRVTVMERGSPGPPCSASGVLTAPPRGWGLHSLMALLWECWARTAKVSGLESMTVPAGVRADPGSGLTLQGAEVQVPVVATLHAWVTRSFGHLVGCWWGPSSEQGGPPRPEER